jgi:hypothetical protein
MARVTCECGCTYTDYLFKRCPWCVLGLEAFKPNEKPRKRRRTSGEIALQRRMRDKRERAQEPVLKVEIQERKVQDIMETTQVKKPRKARVALTEAEITNIRTRLQNGEGQVKLAGEYNVSQGTISRIKTGKI